MNRKITIISSIVLLLAMTSCLHEEMTGLQTAPHEESLPLWLESLSIPPIMRWRVLLQYCLILHRLRLSIADLFPKPCLRYVNA